jgi:hypothetical protein
MASASQLRTLTPLRAEALGDLAIGIDASLSSEIVLPRLPLTIPPPSLPLPRLPLALLVWINAGKRWRVFGGAAQPRT